jgi:hypothetical protein
MHATSRGVSVALWTATAVAAFGIGWITPPPYGPPAPDEETDLSFLPIAGAGADPRWTDASTTLHQVTSAVSG